MPDQPQEARSAAQGRDDCPTCGRLPFGRASGPDPSKLYLCPYCNEGARLRDEGVVVDRFSNVCHEACLEKERRIAARMEAA